MKGSGEETVVVSWEPPPYQGQRHAFGGGSRYPGVLGDMGGKEETPRSGGQAHCRENAEYDR